MIKFSQILFEKLSSEQISKMLPPKTSNDENYYYHVTPSKNLKKIKQSGELISGKKLKTKGNMESPFEDIVYFSIRDYVGIWMGALSDHTNIDKISILRVPKNAVNFNSYSAVSIQSSVSIPTKYLEIYDPKRKNWNKF